MPAVLLSVVFGLLSVGLQWWNPPGLLDFLLSAIGGCLVVIWLTVIASYLRLHPRLEARGEITRVRMWGYPWLAWLTLAAVIAIVGLMLADEQARGQVIAVCVVCAVVLAAAGLTTLIRGRRAPEDGYVR